MSATRPYTLDLQEKLHQAILDATCKLSELSHERRMLQEIQVIVPVCFNEQALAESGEPVRGMEPSPKRRRLEEEPASSLAEPAASQLSQALFEEPASQAQAFGGVEPVPSAAHLMSESERAQKLEEIQKEERRYMERVEKYEAKKKELQAELNELVVEENKETRALALVCAQARNSWCSARILRIYKEEIRPDAPSKDVEELPVFMTSASDYENLRGAGSCISRPSTFTTLEQTGVPALQRHIIKLGFCTQLQHVKAVGDRIHGLVCQVNSYLQDRGTQSPQSRQRIYAVFVEEQKKLQTHLQQLVETTRIELVKLLSEKMGQDLQSGVNSAIDKAVPCVEKFSKLHWSTYSAILRREGGPYKSGKGEMYDINQSLSNPLLEAISKTWEVTFSTKLPGFLEQVQAKANALLQETHEALARQLLELHVDPRRVNQAQSPELARGHFHALQMLRHDVLQEANNEQQDLSRDVVPGVQAGMNKAYTKATGERGQGCTQRKKPS
eukprot:g71518.t1